MTRLRSRFDCGDIVINFFVGLKKAFDTVSSDILLKKLEVYGIRGNLLKLCESYLNDRYQYIVFNGVKSLKKVVTCGVPQGSILGPLFFLSSYERYFQGVSVFTQHSFSMLTIRAFICHTKKLHSLINLMSTDLRLISEWVKSNKLTLNISKTFYKVFHRGRKNGLGILSCSLIIQK